MADPGFPKGAPTLEERVLTYYLAYFFFAKKSKKIKKKWTEKDAREGCAHHSEIRLH